MMRWLVLALVCLGGVAAPGVASAQWETPNRAFHKPPVFELDGQHLTLPCSSCHVNGQTKGTPTTCVGCHWARRQDDPYQLRLGTQCEQCHRTSSWTAVRWDHGAMTGMPLNVAHKTIGCESCHRSGTFTAANVSCASCHTKDYDATREPNHRAAGFPLACETCHQPSDATFTQGRFDHNASFQLVGAHATTECASCHRPGVYAGTPRECVGCHRAEYERTTAPNHVAAGFSTACETCHRPTDATFVSGQPFNHAAIFPLVGRHAVQECATCHANNRFAGTPRDCVGCHRPDYDRTTSPNHAAAGFSMACESCHRPSDSSFGSGGGFNHNTVFPLVGEHARQDCASCHRNNVFDGTPTDCVGCHRDDYQRTTAPNHAATGLGTDCASCHRANAPSWDDGSFDHNSVFRLLGEHAKQVCGVCHVNNVFAGTPRDCVGCHRADYDRTASPSHRSAGFPMTCEVCHRAGDSSWGQGRFTHSWFPINSGPHANRECRDCHTTAGNFTAFSCTTCHSRSETDSEHRERPGYAYDSNRCYACHPNGRSD
jgi:hypothetical protein